MLPLWTAFLESVELEPFDSPFWTREAIALMCGELHDLATRKRDLASRASADAAALVARIEAEDEWRTYFEMTFPATWSEAQLRRAQCDQVRSELDRWLSLLAEHRRLRHEPSVSISLDVPRFLRITRLREQILEQTQAIHNRVSRLPSESRLLIDSATVETQLTSTKPGDEPVAPTERCPIELPAELHADDGEPPVSGSSLELTAENHTAEPDAPVELAAPRGHLPPPIATATSAESATAVVPPSAPPEEPLPSVSVAPVLDAKIPPADSDALRVASERVGENQPSPPTAEPLQALPASPAIPEVVVAGPLSASVSTEATPGREIHTSIVLPATEDISLLATYLERRRRQVNPALPVPEPDPDPERIFDFYLDSGDLAAAYWVARCLTDQGANVPDPNLCALCAAADGPLTPRQADVVTELAMHVDRRLKRELEEEEYQLLAAAEGELDATAVRDGHDALRCLRIAASLQPLLFAGFPWPEQWHVPPTSMPWLSSLTEGVASLPATLGGPVTAELWADAELWVRLQAEMRNWLKELRANYVDPTSFVSINRRVPNLPGTIEHLLAPGQDLGRIATIVLSDDTAQARELDLLQQRWRDAAYVSEATWKITNAIMPERIRHDWGKLYGPPLTALTKLTAAGCDLAKAWLERFELLPDGADSGRLARAAETGRRLLALRKQAALLPKRLEDASTAASPRTRAAVRVLARAIQRLIDLTSFSAPSAGPGVDLRRRLNERLWWFPAVRCDRDGTPLDGQSEVILGVLNGAPTPSGEAASSAFTAFLAARDFEGAARVLTILHSDIQPEAKRALVRAADEARTADTELAAQLRKELDRQHLDGSIDETEYLLYRDQLDELAHADVVPAALAADLDHIGASLLANWARRRAAIDESVGALHADLATADVSLTARETAMQRMEQLRDVCAAREVAELSAQLRRVIDGGYDVEARIAAVLKSAGPVGPMALETFLERAPVIETFCDSKTGLASLLYHVKRGNVPAGLCAYAAPRDLAGLLETWNELHESKDSVAASKFLTRLMTMLGFQRPRNTEPSANVEILGSITHGTLSLFAPGAPIPEFGSQTREIYRTAIVTEPMEHARLTSQLNPDRWPHFVFYRGALSMYQRRALNTRLTEVSRSALVVDEVLLLHLALRELPERNATLFLCTLPFGAANPYATAISQPIEPEMFFGRERLADLILKGQRNVLLYGGRQLGKSALLLKIRRDCEKDSSVTIPVFHIIDNDPSESIWAVIHRSLRSAGYIRSASARSDRAAVEADIVEASRVDARRVLVLLDESDSFLRREMDTDCGNLNAFRRIHAATTNKFRVVLAGNYGLLRYAHLHQEGLKNSAGELYEPIVVGPLGYVDALKLIQEPMEALGFRFDGEQGWRAIQRILDWTFSQAGLLQLFLYHLVDHLQHERVRRPKLPMSVTPEDVDRVAIANDSALLQKVRSRFRLTVELDVEYEAILVSMLLANQPGKYVDTVAVRQTLQARWPRGINKLLGRFDGSLRALESGWLRARLHEMVGLGVLLERHTDDGPRFAIRSESLRRLYGDTLEPTMRRLADEDPTEENGIELVHPLIPDSGLFSLLSNGEQWQLSPARRRCIHLIGAPVTGVEQLPRDVQRMARRFVPNGESITVPAEIKDPRGLALWLREVFVPNTRKDGRYFVVCRIHEQSASLLDEFRRIVIAAYGSPTKDRLVNVWLHLDPPGLFRALTTNPHSLAEAPDGMTATLILSKWELPAIRARLYVAQGVRSLAGVRTLHKQTGGWPYLLWMHDQTIGSGRQADARWTRRLAERELACEFVVSLGLTPNSPQFLTLDRVVASGAAFLTELDSLLEERSVTGAAERHAAIESLRLLKYLNVSGQGAESIVEPDNVIAGFWKHAAQNR